MVIHMAPFIIIGLERISQDHPVFSWVGLVLKSLKTPRDLTGQM